MSQWNHFSALLQRNEGDFPRRVLQRAPPPGSGLGILSLVVLGCALDLFKILSTYWGFGYTHDASAAAYISTHDGIDRNIWFVTLEELAKSSDVHGDGPQSDHAFDKNISSSRQNCWPKHTRLRPLLTSRATSAFAR